MTPNELMIGDLLIIQVLAITPCLNQNYTAKSLDIFYISPSELPSRSANAVHVMHMCDALSKLGHRVTIFGKRSIPSDSDLLETLREAYAVELANIRLITFFGGRGRGDNLRIALLALATFLREGEPALILSRNLYAAFILAVMFRTSMVFETHQVEVGLRKFLQRSIVRQSHVLTLVISEKLLSALESNIGSLPARSLVLHDAAPAGIGIIPEESKFALRSAWLAEMGVTAPEFMCGYFGHLYAGRGLEIIQGMAQLRPNVIFLIFGGNEEDIKTRTELNELSNLKYMGFVNHSKVQKAMASMDLLLMPYQAKVSIGVGGHDTAEWMSPMKMFEYMAANVPIVASRLPALEEVLVHEVNCLLADPKKVDDWVRCLDRLKANPSERRILAQNAYAEYEEEYNWTARARKMLQVVNS